MEQIIKTHWLDEYSYLPAAMLAAFVVFMLFLGMQAMVNVDLGEPEPVMTFKQVNIWQEDPPPPPPPEELTKPNDPVAPPEMPTQTNISQTGGITVEFEPTSVQPLDRDVGGIQTDVGAIPLVYVQPDYPRRAAERGIEGYCVVSFIITTSGTTRNIVAQECSDSAFASASIRAASQLKYRPKTFNGQPIETEHSFKYSFMLEQ